MKRLIIIGAGGMGRTVYSNALESVGYGDAFEVKGFIDDDLHALDGFPNYPPVIGTISGYQPEADDVFVCSIGGASRKPCMENIISRGGEFINVIHRTARLLTNVVIGKGNFIGADTVIGNDVVIGNYNMIQSYTIIGHDVRMGDFNRIDTRVTCVGGVVIEDEVNIHSSAVISHKVTVESKSRVAALSFVIKDVKTGTTVIGNPAKRLM
ncbi:sugar O-acyltransferase, sialic acid O-acetyltransferase NeuD family [Prevotella sp. khp7]|uniref:acetyltransferase n=1 Tax=Prevotella sp. khp7 TaxID=1761885 RepID=UPI0008B8CCF0|nr:acetyltransferase [Prevotella sp. khp7]SEW22615.1 sugar O-acyltransferase, sialic acid O-acetyltransferase NeuD family [Prevotella sp. khp7]